MTAYVDSNVLIRFLTKDDPEQHQKAFALLQLASRKKCTLIVRPEVIAEILFVLTSGRTYKYSRADTVEILLALLRRPGIKLVDRLAVEQALVTYATSTLDFVDALLAGLAKTGKVKTVCSFDRDFAGIPDMEWLQP